jgi:hypothetical protein
MSNGNAFSQAPQIGQHQHLIIPERKTHASSWGLYHTDLDLPVKHEGEALGHTIRDVPIDRRYALDLGGNTLSQRDFEELHARHYMEHYHIAKRPPDEVHLRAIPSVRDYVSVVCDPQNPAKLVPLADWLHEKNPTPPPAGPKVLYNRKGEPVAMETEAASTTDDLLIRLAQIQEMKDRGVLTAEQHSAEVTRLVSGAGTVEIAPPPPAEPIEHGEGDDEELGSQWKRAPEKKSEMAEAPCGKEVRSSFLGHHKRFCKSPLCNPDRRVPFKAGSIQQPD